MGKRANPRLAGVSFCLWLFAAGGALAGPYHMNYGARLTDATGAPVAGPVHVDVRFFRSASGSDQVAVTLPGLDGVALTGGMLSLDLDLAPADVRTLFNGTDEVWIEIATPDRTWPRQRFGAVPYALAVPVDGTTVTYDGNGSLTLVPGSVSDRLVASGGLSQSSVAGLTTALAAKADASGLAAAFAAKANVTHTHSLSDVTGLTAALAGKADVVHTHTLAGDASGPITGTVVTAIQGLPIGTSPPTTGQVLKWDGTQWSPQADLNGTGGTAESTSASNQGAGTGVYKSMTGFNLNFKSLVAGTNVTLTPSATDITIATAGSLATTQQNGLELKPYAVGAGSTGELRFDELTANGAKYVGLKAADSITNNVVWTLPTADGGPNTVLKTDGAGNLSWVAQPAIPVTSVAGHTGSVTLATSDVTEAPTSLYYTAARATGDARAAISASAPLNYSGATGVLTVTAASSGVNGYLTGGDWNTFNNKQNALSPANGATGGFLAAGDWTLFNGKQPAGNYVLATRNVNTTAPLAGGGSLNGDLTLTLAPAGFTANGYLSSGDWATFNAKTAGGGTVSSITAGTGLSGGTINSSGTIALTNVGTPSTYTKVTTDAQGRVTAGTTLAAGDVPGLDAAKITTGFFGVANGGTGATSAAAALTSLGAVARAGDTMTGLLSLPPNGLAVGTSQLVVVNGNVGVGSTNPVTKLNVGGHTTLSPFGAGAGNTSELRFAELAANGATYAGFKAPDSMASSQIYVLPSAAPTVSGQVLASTTGGVTSWSGLAPSLLTSGGAATNQVLAWNGSAWTPTTLASILPSTNTSCQLGTYVIGFNPDGTIQCSAMGQTYTKVSSGYLFACALVSDTTVRCWGAGSNGQLGNKSTADSHQPVAVKYSSGGLLQNVIDVAAGELHACAIVGNGSPGTQGTVWCWGSNASGQLGDGTVTQRLNAVQVSGITTAVQVTAGYAHSCATLADGTAKCWGAGANYRLGNGGTTNQTTPVFIQTSAGVNMGATGATVVGVSAGWDNSCAWKSDGAAACWGYNGYNQLGDGTATQRQWPVQPTGLNTGVTKISAGIDYNATYAYGHTCAIVNGRAYCWGRGADGEMGDGGTAAHTTPTLVPFADTNDDGVFTDTFDGITDISAGGFHTCAIANPGATIYCWGYNADYAVTNTTSANQTKPFKVRNPTDTDWQTGALSVSVNSSGGGTTFSMGIFTDPNAGAAVLTGWGQNTKGYLGDTTTTATTTYPPTVTLSP